MNTVVGCRHITIKITEKKTNSVKLKNNEKNNTKIISHFLFDTEVFSIQAPMIHMLIDRVSSCHLSLHNTKDSNSSTAKSFAFWAITCYSDLNSLFCSIKYPLAPNLPRQILNSCGKIPQKAILSCGRKHINCHGCVQNMSCDVRLIASTVDWVKAAVIFLSGF